MQSNYNPEAEKSMREQFEEFFGTKKESSNMFARMALTDAENLTSEAVDKELQNPDIKSVTLHKPGEIVKMMDGSKYIVQENGSWKKL